MTEKETKTEKEIGRREFLGKLGMGLAGIALAGLSAGCGDEESISRTEYPIVPVAKPEICESETELKVEGRFVSPAIYCKDKEKRQVACRLKMTSEPPACYVLEK